MNTKKRRFDAFFCYFTASVTIIHLAVSQTLGRRGQSRRVRR